MNPHKVRVFLITCFLCAFACTFLNAQSPFGQGIRDFVIKEHLSQNGKLAIIATDSAGMAEEHINGTFKFVINGFDHDLRFHDGVGVAPNAINASAFVFIKHANHFGSNGKLFYVVKNDRGLKPIFINWYYLIIIPLLIIVIGYVFKRLLIVAVIALVGLFVYNYSKGLDLQNLIETIVHGVRDWIKF